MYLKLKKGDTVIYLSNMPYVLSNGQMVNKEGAELFIRSNVTVQKKFFRQVNKPKVNKLKQHEGVANPKDVAEGVEIKKEKEVKEKVEKPKNKPNKTKAKGKNK